MLKHILMTSCFLVSLTAYLPSLAQKLPDNIRFTHKISASSDFVGEVLVVHQDKFGFMWVAGKGGVARYNGYDYELFKYEHQSDNTLANSVVNAIAEDEAGNLWFGTNAGLSFYQRDKKTFTNFYHDKDNINSLGNQRIISLHREKDTLWIGTDGGLDSIDLNTHVITRYPTDPSLADLASVYVLGITSQDNRLYFVSGSGFKIWDKSTNEIEVYGARGTPLPDGLPETRIRSILIDSHGYIWLGTLSGISRFDPKTKTFKAYDDDYFKQTGSYTEVWQFLEDQHGQLWAGADGAGLMRYNREADRFKSYMHNRYDPFSISSSVVHSLFEDNVGDLWIGLYPAGVDVIHRDTAPFQVFSNTTEDNTSVNWNGITAITEDSAQNLWLGTDGGGLNIYNHASGTYDFITHVGNAPTDIRSTAILDLLQDNQNRIWIGYWGGGVSLLDPSTLTMHHFDIDIEDPKKLNVSEVFSIYQDNNNDIWVGTMGGGLSKFNPDTYSLDIFIYDQSKPFEHNPDRIWVIYEDSRNHLWLGTDTGLIKVNRDAHTSVVYTYNPSDPTSLSNNFVQSIVEDSQGRLWIATKGGGLNQYHYDSHTFTAVRSEHGLVDENIFHIIEDNNGLLWLSTNNGIASYNAESGEILNYSVISDEESLRFQMKSGQRAKNGDIIFGSIHGYVRFNPNEVSINTHIPNIYITDLRVFNRHVPISEQGILQGNIFSTDTIRLNHHQNLFTLNFSALNYRNSEKNQFSYKLEGFDDNWQEVGNVRSATYTNLDPGTYTFRVRGSNNSDQWNTQGASLDIVIIPPPWRTWWAYLSYTLIILASVSWYIFTQRKIIGYQRAMVNSLSEVDKVKDQFIASTSHELRTPLFGIVGLAENLMEETTDRLNNTERHSLDMIISSGKRLVTQVNDILDLASMKKNTLPVNIQPVSIYELAEIVVQLLKPTIPSKDIQLINNVDIAANAVLGDSNRVQQILINLISNALRYTTTGSVSVSAYPEGDMMTIAVKDTGSGIPKDKFDDLFQEFKQLGDIHERARKGGTGLGLTIAKRLIELQNGKIWVESKLGQGSCFYFSLPLTNDAPKTFTVSMAAKARIQSHQNQEKSTLNVNQGVAKGALSNTSMLTKKQGEQYNILIVDDEKVNRMVLAAYLKGDHYNTLEAETGDQAIALVSQNANIDLVILDVNMPGISGLDACKKIREIRSIKALPIIFSTAHGSIEDIAEYYHSGGNDLIQKPIDKNEFIARLDFQLHLYELIKPKS